MAESVVTIDNACITTDIARTLAQMQANGNEELELMKGNIGDLKRFLIHLNGSGEEPSTILNHLATIQFIEDTLDGLKLTNKPGNHE